MGNIMSVDQSLTCTGVCIFSSSGKLLHFECVKTTNENTIIERISIISTRIVELYVDNKCVDIVFEQLSYGSMGDATRNLAGLLFTIETKLFEQLGLDEITKLPPTSVKKFACGFGGSTKRKITKKDMMDALPEDTYNAFYNAGYLRSKGLADLADAYYIGKLHLDNTKKLAQVEILADLP